MGWWMQRNTGRVWADTHVTLLCSCILALVHCNFILPATFITTRALCAVCATKILRFHTLSRPIHRLGSLQSLYISFNLPYFASLALHSIHQHPDWHCAAFTLHFRQFCNLRLSWNLQSLELHFMHSLASCATYFRILCCTHIVLFARSAT